MSYRPFRDRRDAGRVLAVLPDEYRGHSDVIVLGLPRGGVPVAYLGAPLDVFEVRKLGVPGREELATGAIASGGVTVINDDVHLVLIGEASHGTGEFCTARTQMTRRLIEERGSCAVAAEADWPDAYRVNRYVRGRGEDATAEEALHGFERFPTWMWRNAAVLDFVGLLRGHNDWSSRDERAKAGFYGLDLYSLYRSVHEVITYLDRVDPAAAARARQRYACFDHFSDDDAQVYGFAAAFGAGEPCEYEVVEQLVDLQRHAVEYARRDGLLTARVMALTDWVVEYRPTTGLPVGLFGASTGAAATLVAAAQRPGPVAAVVSRGGRPDLVGEYPRSVVQPVLLIVRARDTAVIELNRKAMRRLRGEARLEVIAGASHLFSEPGALEVVALLARDWFTRYLKPGCDERRA